MPVSLVLGIAQYLVINYLLSSLTFFISTWSIYLFHVSVTLLIMVTLLAVAKTAFDKVGYAFMACSILKMCASILFLIPLIKGEQTSKIPDTIAFFIPYFIYLAVDMYFTLRLLNQNES